MIWLEDKNSGFGISKTSLLADSYNNIHNKLVRNPSSCI